MISVFKSVPLLLAAMTVLACAPARATTIAVAAKEKGQSAVKVSIPNFEGAMGVVGISSPVGWMHAPEVVNGFYSDGIKATKELIEKSGFEYVSTDDLTGPVVVDGGFPGLIMAFKWSDSEAFAVVRLHWTVDVSYPVKDSKVSPAFWYYLVGTEDSVSPLSQTKGKVLVGSFDDKAIYDQWMSVFDPAMDAADNVRQ